MSVGNLQGKLFLEAEQEHFAGQLRLRYCDLFLGQEARGWNVIRRVAGYTIWKGKAAGSNGMCNVVYVRDAVFL